ncbi:MAG TPA: ester cyclase [Edaphobacter sp.]
MTFLEHWVEEVWNKGRAEAIDLLVLPNVIHHGLLHPDGTPVENHTAFRAFHKQFRASFSDLYIKVEQTITEGNLTVARCTVTATHTGDGLGYPATGRPVRITGIIIARIEDGLLAEAWNQFDFASLIQQVSDRRDPASPVR